MRENHLPREPRWGLIGAVEESEKTRRPPVLEHVGTGAQAHVFGGDGWVVKIRRKSVLGFLGRMITRRKWERRIRDELGDLILPFVEVRDVEFYAPEISSGWQSGEAAGGSTVHYRVGRALVMPRVPAEDFFDRRVSGAEPAELVALLGDFLETLRAVRGRGFYMVDFVMKNFVYWKGALRVADPGLVVPEESLWEPTLKIGSWGFAKGLSRDFLRQIREAQEVARGKDLDDLRALEDRFEGEIDALRARDAAGERRTDGVGQQFPGEIERRARLELEGGRGGA